MQLLEFTIGASPKVCRDERVIRDVKFLGRVSKNGRTYSDRALTEAARMYEGLKINLNHPDKSTPGAERPIQDAFGWAANPVVRGDGVYGDLYYIESHPCCGMILEAAERNPRRFGFSHNAQGEVSNKNGRVIVESITSVVSLDIVQNPATTNGLFESQQEEPVTTASEIENAALATFRDTGMSRGEKLRRLGELMDLASKVQAALGTDDEDAAEPTGAEDVQTGRGMTSGEKGEPTEPDETTESLSFAHRLTGRRPASATNRLVEALVGRRTTPTATPKPERSTLVEALTK